MTCRQFLWRAFAANALPSDLVFTDIGTWWGAGDKELDVAALNAESAIVLVGSCKWTNSPMDLTEYAALLADVKAVASDLKLDANAVGTATGPWLALFSRTGFTPRLEQLAAQQEPQRLLLFALPTLYSA